MGSGRIPVGLGDASGTAEREAGRSGAIRVGIDENGLGSRLGPMIVTAVAARVTSAGELLFRRRPRGRLARDLDDSKQLLTYANVGLGEAWARVLTGGVAATPEELLWALSLEDERQLSGGCPTRSRPQCWREPPPAFVADAALLDRIEGHRRRLEQRGVSVLALRCRVLCTGHLNQQLAEGHNRFVVDLHSMEALALHMRRQLAEPLRVVCGKVGGMRDYPRFFGPLAQYSYTTLEREPDRSRYRIPALGEICFARDADAKDPLVMLASLVGKYVRELLMARIQRFYGPADAPRVSGYHDPRTSAWVASVGPQRRSLRIVDACFERARASS